MIRLNLSPVCLFLSHYSSTPRDSQASETKQRVLFTGSRLKRTFNVNPASERWFMTAHHSCTTRGNYRTSYSSITCVPLLSLSVGSAASTLLSGEDVQHSSRSESVKDVCGEMKTVKMPTGDGSAAQHPTQQQQQQQHHQHQHCQQAGALWHSLEVSGCATEKAEGGDI